MSIKSKGTMLDSGSLRTRLQHLIQEVAAPVKGKTPTQLVHGSWVALIARLYLRRCTRVGPFTRVQGRPRVANQGTLIIEERVFIWSTVVPSELAVFKGGRLEIGAGTHINYGSSIAATGLVRIGRKCRLGTYTMILDNDFHEVEDRDRMPPPRPVILEDNVWLGHRTLVLPGVSIGHDAVIGAGSVVMTNIPPRSVALGNPARVIRSF